MTASLPSTAVATNAYRVPSRRVLGAVAVDPAIGAVAAWAGPAAAACTRVFLTATLRNPHTRRAYRGVVSRFVARCVARGQALSEISAPDVADYLEELSRGMQVPSVKQHLAALKHWFDVLVVEGLLAYSPAHAVRGPRTSRPCGKTPVMSADEVRRLFAGIDAATLIGARDRALFSVMLFSFARIGAVLKMRVRDYQGRGGEGAVFLLHEKGGRVHRVSAHRTACAYLDAYLALAGLADDAAAPLWQGVRHGHLTGRVLTQDRACKLVKERCRGAGLSDAFGNHSFRATGITLYRAAGGDLVAAQRIAGHASVRSTEAYDRSGAELDRAEVERVQL